MLDVNLKEITQGLERDDLTFSYVFKKSLLPDGISLTLHQQETGFSLMIQLKEENDTLSVTKFSLVEKSDLEQQSLSLYDAAMVEIALQALDLLFIVADHVDVSEIAFSITKDEAMHLSAFTCFFDVHFALQTSSRDYDVFVNKTEILKTTIRRELWQRQGHDRYLRHYLQNCQKGHVFSETKFIPTPQQPSNIIAFPL
jgi:hypothetical protein